MTDIQYIFNGEKRVKACDLTDIHIKAAAHFCGLTPIKYCQKTLTAGYVPGLAYSKLILKEIKSTKVERMVGND